MQLAKSVLARGHMLRLLARYALGGKLTVVAFHRVLPGGDGRAAEANPEWTLEAGFFARILETLGGYFRFVSEDDVVAYFAGKASLPPRALLVTFDDGWQDNFDYALEPLRRLRIPALFFVSAGYLGAREYYWQEALYARYAQRLDGPISERESRAIAGAGLADPGGAWTRSGLIKLIADLHGAREASRLTALETLLPDGPERRTGRLFMDADELRQLRGAGMAIGAHGVMHEPFTRLPDPEGEARKSLSLLQESLGAPVRSMSYPHGSLDAKVREAVRGAGFSLAFSSAPGANGRGADPFDIRRHFLPNWRLPRFPDSESAGPVLEFNLVWELVKAGHV